MKKLFLITSAASLLIGVGSDSQAGLFDKMKETGVKVVKAQKSPSESEEVEMGRQFAAVVMGAFPPAGSEALNQYVTKVGQTVAQASSRPNLNYHFQVIDARDPRGNEIVNAFATPGGYIFVTQGLLRRTKSEAELAGVLGHEIAHAAEKHAFKAVKKMKTTEALVGLGTDVAGEEASKHAGVAAGVTKEFISVIAPAIINNLFEKGFSRADEYKADSSGAQFAAKAGYDPKGLIGFLETVKARSGRGHYGTLLRTHPAPDDRIDRLEKLIKSKKLDEGKKQDLAGRYKATAAL